ncbi:MAG: NAD(+) synthase [Candidatus Rokubacteria bacterium RIFCSPHIGHO2_02_FULL_73_26]|nr:MAG: NAD(+) synthase [Candidatus Rokubacteria bacterium RIFCSPHIGHO2_02_FULL_73_26]
MRPGEEFFNLYTHDLLRVAVAVPGVRVADPAHNAGQVLAQMREAAARRAAVVLFPELCLSAYSCEDLFQQRALLDASLAALARVVEASAALPVVAVVGLPLALEHQLYNCAAVVAGGRVLGVVPKTYLPNYREFYERRQFSSGDSAVRDTVDLPGARGVPFGSRLLFRLENQPLATLHVELCEDLWVPLPPSTYAALAGATLLLNLSASNVTIAKADYRRELVGGQSARCLAACLYAAAGPGESTTDLAWDGHALVYEDGTRLAESRRFSREPQLLTADVDLERLSQERMRQTSFGQTLERHRGELAGFRVIPVALELPRRGRLLPERRWERFPYVPADPARRAERCAEVYEIQVQGLVKRLEFSGLRKVVIGISGGLDSTHALLVCARALDALGLPRANILAYTMPGFATSRRTLEQAHGLMRAVGASAHELDIRPSAGQMLRDIGHPYARGERVYDVTFENVQAGERTSHLFRLANLHGALVVGTGDLSELALGWCTYGVGDQMSHYAVSASVPKTLIQHVIRWVADTGRLGAEASATLGAILETEISPELVPADGGEAEPAQETEAAIGPFELQDFTLYYTLRFGYPPPKVAFLARFFRQSQFKRSAIPNAPKVGSGGSLSPRGDWRAPSDGEAAPWLAALDLVPDAE